MMRTSRENSNSYFINGNHSQSPGAEAWIGRFPWIAVDNMLDCLGFAEGQHECDRLSGRFKRLERQILYRQLLLEEVIHRTNNTLQQAISAVDAQIVAANDAWKAHDLRALRARLRKLRGANHQLYGPGDCVGSSLKNRLSEICSSIFESFGRRMAYVALSLNVADIELQRHQEVCVCLITQELVTNALKHGFPDNRRGIVSVELDIDTDCFCHLIVTDNGIQKCTLYRGSGLALVEGFVSLLEGRLEFDVNQGTTVRASFPVVP